MNIIPSHTNQSIPVEKYADIKEDAEKMKKLLNADNFQGDRKSGLALSHCQVVEKNPKNFFVVHQGIKNIFSDKDVIMNAKILEKSGKFTFKEACLNFPHREEIKKKRYNKVVVEYQVQGFLGMRTIETGYQGLAALIIQHEVDHANGRNIYQK